MSKIILQIYRLHCLISEPTLNGIKIAIKSRKNRNGLFLKRTGNFHLFIFVANGCFILTVPVFEILGFSKKGQIYNNLFLYFYKEYFNFLMNYFKKTEEIFYKYVFFYIQLSNLLVCKILTRLSVCLQKLKNNLSSLCIRA